MDISLRSATYDDKDFYFLIRKTTIKPYTDEYSEWNDENEYENILLKINPVQDKVIMTNGIDIGLLSVSDFNDVIFIEMINIVKEYQNRGLGKWIDRKLFAAMLRKLNIPQPPNGLATNEAEALEAAHKLTYPVLVRPSFVLGGRAMQIVYSDNELAHYMRFAVEASPERPVLVDKFLEDATEVDVDCIADVGLFSDRSWGAVPTASARVSSSIIAAFMPPSHSKRMVSRP